MPDLSHHMRTNNASWLRVPSPTASSTTTPGHHDPLLSAEEQEHRPTPMDGRMRDLEGMLWLCEGKRAFRPQDVLSEMVYECGFLLAPDIPTVDNASPMK